MNKVYQFFGGKKYFFAEQVFLVSLSLLLVGKIKAENFIEVTVWTLAIYAGSNIIEKIGLKTKGGKENE